MDEWIDTLNILTPPLLRMLPPMIASMVKFSEIRRCHCFPITFKRSIVYGLIQTLQYILHVLYMSTQGRVPMPLNFAFNWLGSFGAAIIDGLPIVPCGYQQSLRKACLTKTFGESQASRVLALKIQQHAPRPTKDLALSTTHPRRHVPNLTYKDLGHIYIALFDTPSLSISQLEQMVLSHPSARSRSHSSDSTRTNSEDHKELQLVEGTLTLDAGWHPVASQSSIQGDKMY